MTKNEAYQEMLKGFKMKHEYYSPEEFVFINEDGKFETEDGCVHGNRFDEFWSVYQKWEDGWDYYDEDKIDRLLSFDSPYYKDGIYEYKMLERYDDFLYGKPTKSQLEDAKRIESIKSKPLINRNDLCHCGSGLKFKKCCLKNN